MKRRIKRLAFLILLIVLAFLLSGNRAAASPDFPVIHSVETFCSAGAAEQSWFAGVTHHGRNALYTSIVTDLDPPYLIKESNNYANWNINLVTYQGVGWGTFEQVVPGSNDGWKGIYNNEMYIAWPLVEMPPNGDPLWLGVGKGVGHGTGSFFGMQLKVEYYQSVEVFDEEPTGYPCVTGQTVDGKYFVLQSYVTGYIIGQ